MRQFCLARLAAESHSSPAVRFVFLPVMDLSGFWILKGHVLRRLIFEKVGLIGVNSSHDTALKGNLYEKR